MARRRAKRDRVTVLRGRVLRWLVGQVAELLDDQQLHSQRNEPVRAQRALDRASYVARMARDFAQERVP